MRNLVIDCRLSGPSGIGVYIDSVIPKVIAHLSDWSFTLLVSPDSIDTFTPLVDNCCSLVTCDAKGYSIKEQLILPFLLRNADLFWSPHYTTPLFSSIPFIVTVHDVAHLVLPEHKEQKLKQLYAQLFLRRVQQKAKLIFTVSEFTKKEFIHYFGEPNGRCVAVLNGVSDRWFIPTNGQKKVDFPYICVVGNMKPHKQPELVGEAFADLASTIPHHLVYAGKPANNAYIKAWFKTNHPNMLTRVHFFEELSPLALQSIVEQAEALLFPSKYEGFGLPPLEAMACGIPVVASSIPAVKEVCGDIPLYFLPDSVTELKQQLLALFAMKNDEKQRLSNKGKELAKKYSWDATAQSISTHILSFCEESL